MAEKEFEILADEIAPLTEEQWNYVNTRVFPALPNSPSCFFCRGVIAADAFCCPRCGWKVGA